MRHTNQRAGTYCMLSFILNMSVTLQPSIDRKTTSSSRVDVKSSHPLPHDLCDSSPYKVAVRQVVRSVTNSCRIPPPNSNIVGQIAETLRSRMVEVAFEEWTDSLYVGVDKRSHYVWAKYNWWMVPWWDLVGGVTEDPFGINSTSSYA